MAVLGEPRTVIELVLQPRVFSPATIREIIQRRRISELLNDDPNPRIVDLKKVVDHAISAVDTGRFFVLRDVSDMALADLGTQGYDLYMSEKVVSPFTDAWMFSCPTGDGSGEIATTVWLVVPKDDVYEIIMMVAYHAEVVPVLLMGDTVLLNIKPASGGLVATVCCAPSTNPKRTELARTETLESTVVWSVLDPFFACMALLNGSAALRTEVVAPPKLQQARKRSGKPPIPPHTVLDGRYITPVQPVQRDTPGHSGDGHHASPVGHIRRAHTRKLASGRTLFVREAWVNVPEEARATFNAPRSYYTVKP